MDNIAQNLKVINNKVGLAAERSGREPRAIKLVAVSKYQTIAAIKEAILAGQYCFGESYLQEALVKIRQLAKENVPGLEWHFIGPIQTNKTRLIAEHFTWVQSIDSLKIAQRLNDQRPTHLPPLNVCIQVKLSSDSSKRGVELPDLPGFAKLVARLPQLTLRGLMLIPTVAESFALDAKPFCLLNQALYLLKSQGMQLDTLSMGMSTDYELAITEGATMIRLGTSLFGKREG